MSEVKVTTKSSTITTEWAKEENMKYFEELNKKYVKPGEVHNAETQMKRRNEYPAIGEQLDMLWHAIDDGTLDKDSDFYKNLKKVKDDNPKVEVE